MPDLNLVCLGFKECFLLPQISTSLADILNAQIILGKEDLPLANFYSKERGQYDAAQILTEYDQNSTVNKTIIITSIDLFIPIFTFVFGLAKLNGKTGIVSVHRLRSEFYGLPNDEELLMERLTKEVVHELGHLLNLRHCSNYQCVMASSNTADDLDVKGNRFCHSCIQKIP